MKLLFLLICMYGLVQKISGDLNVKCHIDDDCLAFVKNSECINDNCRCRDYYAEYQNNTCLESYLLGSECIMDKQCSNKVANSICLDNICECDKNFIQFRQHTCLPPSQPGEVCFSNNQCKLGNSESICHFLIPNIFGRCQCKKPLKQFGFNCAINNIKTTKLSNFVYSPNAKSSSHVKETVLEKTVVTNLIIRKRNEIGQESVSLGYSCVSDIQCQLADVNSRCIQGICDCKHSSSFNYTCSAQRRGCRPNTFQCHNNGQCISSFFVCDNYPDCLDKSDEFCKSNCPPITFSCTLNGPCITLAKRCDGKNDCINGADEHNCIISANNTQCPPNTFQCTNGQCIPEYKFCNAIKDCKDGSDENKNSCRGNISKTDYCPLRCMNGRCRSNSIACTGKDGCGDLTDEIDCSVCKCQNPDIE